MLILFDIYFSSLWVHSHWNFIWYVNIEYCFDLNWKITSTHCAIDMANVLQQDCACERAFHWLLLLLDRNNPIKMQPNVTARQVNKQINTHTLTHTRLCHANKCIPECLWVSRVYTFFSFCFVLLLSICVFSSIG